MKRIFAGMLVVMTMMLFGCSGGSSSGGTTTDTGAKKAAVTGSVSFPAMSALVAKQVAANVIPPVLTITDLNGAAVATPTLTVDALDPKKYTYSISLDVSKNYILKASWGGQVLRGLADQGTLNSSTTVINITPVSTAAVLVAEKMLNLTPGQLGTTAANSVTPAQLTALNPAALLSAVENGDTGAYATLVAAVTTALSEMKDPVAVTAVTTAVTEAPAYVAPLSFTSAMISGKSFIYSDTAGNSGVVTFSVNGTFTNPGGTGTWSINAAGQLVALETDETSTMTLTSNTGSVITASIVSSTSGTRTATFTAVTPNAGFTTAMLSGKSFNYSDSAGNTSILTFNANGNYNDNKGNSGTWSINASGQLVVVEADETSTVTLTGNTGTVITASIFTVSTVSGASVTRTATLAAMTTPKIASIIGTWGGYGDPKADTKIITFVDSTHYMISRAGLSDGFGQSGLEFGTYTFDPATGAGALATSPIFDTNGAWGASHPPAGTLYLFSVSGDTLTVGNAVEGNTQLPRLQSSATNPVVGSWWAPFTDFATGNPGGVLIAFLDDTHCLLAQAGHPGLDPTGQSGIELGTYTISSSKVFSTSLVVDTNGEWGFSNPPAGSTSTVSVSGNTLTFNNQVEGSFVSTRLQ